MQHADTLSLYIRVSVSSELVRVSRLFMIFLLKLIILGENSFLLLLYLVSFPVNFLLK